MKYNTVFERLQNLINRKPTQSEICKIINVNPSTMTNRQNRNSDFVDEEIEKLNDFYSVNLYTQEVNNIEDCLNLPVRGKVSASMGTGIQVYDESQTGVYKISAKVLKDIGANPIESDIIFAEGDSMEPTIQGGSALIVDKSKTDVKDGKIYCINFNGALMAKRLQLLPPKKLRVISDNFNKYPAWDVDFSKEIDFNFTVVGEVMRWMTNAR